MDNLSEGCENKQLEKQKPLYGFMFYGALFFLFSIAGWIWEVGIYLIRDGEFVNRGILIGPWLPIYGAGGILLSFILGKYKEKPVKVFFASMLVCTILEYLTGWLLERVWGVRWWDYSNEFLNISGRVCLWASLMFGLGGWLLICYVMPYLRMLYRKICRLENGKKALNIICISLIIIFVADAAWAADFPNMGKGVAYTNEDGIQSK